LPLPETAPSAALIIRLFGGLNFEFQGEERTAHFSGRLRALLALLLLEHDRAHQRQSVAYALWPDSSEKQARTNLRKLLLLLRAGLGPCAGYLVVTDQTIGWRMDDQCWIDVVAFRQSIEAAKNERGHKAIQCYSQAAALYRGDLLPDCYDEWIVACRELLREHFLYALHESCGLLESEGRYGEGVAMARQLLQHDPINERGHLYLIRYQALMQDRAGALQSYHRCATLLRRELGVDPSPAMDALYLQLLDHDLAAVPALPAQSEKSVPLIGRREAWKTLLARWQQAQRGGAHFVLIVGEAGIGKSRLAEEILLWVERQGNVAAHSRAYRSDNRTLTYAPVAALLRSPVLAGEVRTLPAYWLTEIARLIPEILFERDDVPPPQRMTDDWQRHHLFAALTQALLPKRRPRLVVIDDLQWSDSETLAWLPHLLEAAKDEPLLVVGTVRSEEFDDYDALQTLCETLRTMSTTPATSSGRLTEIHLGPLDAAAVGELAYEVAGNALDEQQAAWMMQATEGNPLFVIETARLWQDDAPLSAGSATPSLFSHRPETVLARLPQSVLSVIEARLARLSKSARNLAEVAATIGRSFTLPVLAAASALEEDALVDALDELWRRRIIRERGADAYDFSHDRIRDGAYAGTSGLRRRLLHKRVAAAIAATHRGQHAGDQRELGGALDEISGQLGYHYEQANERLLAIEHYLAAARLSSAQYAHAETLRYLDRVLALALPEEHAIQFEALLCRDRVLELSAPTAAWRENLEQIEMLAQMEEADKAVAMRRRGLVAERKSRLLVRQMELRAAVELGRAAVEYASKSGDPHLQAQCHYGLGVRLWYVADFQEAIPHIEHAIEVARASGADEVLANALELRAQTHMFNGGSAATISQLLDECLVILRRTGNMMGRCAILNKLGYLPVAQGAGRYDDAIAYYREGLQIAQQLNLLPMQINVLRNLAVAYTCMGNYAAAKPYLDQAQAIHIAQGAKYDDPVLLNYRGFLDLNAGRLRDALDAQQRALAGLTAQGHPQWRVKALTALGWIHQRLGKPDEAMRYAEVSLAQCYQINEQRQAAYTLILLGTLHTERGELAQARSDFVEARAILHSFEIMNRAQEADAGLAYLALLTGDVAAAREGAAGLLAHMEAHPLDYTEDVCQVLYLCGRILAAMDAPNLPRLGRLVAQHFATRTATLDAASARLFWQMPIHAALRELCHAGL
jgi:DNA-binding SARP family transcriptional activator/predicted ATPase